MRQPWGSPGQRRALRKMMAARKAQLRGKASKPRRRTNGSRSRTALIANPSTARQVAARRARSQKRFERQDKRAGSRARRTGRVKGLVKRSGSSWYKAKYHRLVPEYGSAAWPIAGLGTKTPRKSSTSKPRRRTTKGTRVMAKRRRKSASPRRRKTAVRRRRAAPRRVSTKRSRPRRRLRTVIRLGPSKRRRTVYINGSRNGMALVKSTFTSFAAGFVAGGLSAVVDKQFATKPNIARIAKVLAAFGIAKFGARHPRAAAAAIGALASSEGYNMATKFLGGAKAAHTPDQAVQGLADMSEAYPEMGALLNGGMGALLAGDEGMDGPLEDYQGALSGSTDYDYAD